MLLDVAVKIAYLVEVDGSLAYSLHLHAPGEDQQADEVEDWIKGLGKT